MEDDCEIKLSNREDVRIERLLKVIEKALKAKEQDLSDWKQKLPIILKSIHCRWRENRLVLVWKRESNTWLRKPNQEIQTRK